MASESPDIRASLKVILAGRSLPIIRQTAAQVISLLSNPNSSVETIAKTILHDQAFTARALNVANSAYYRRKSEKITNVSQAIAMMGFNTLRDIGVAAEFAELVQKRLPNAVNLRRLLAKAFVAGHQATTLGQAIRLPDAEGLFTSALLETVGEFALAAYLPKAFTQVTDTIKATSLPYDEAHLQATGLTPHEVTEIVVSTMALPEGLVLPPPAWDSQPQWTPADRRQALVHLTNALATNLFGQESPEIVSQFNTLMDRTVTATGLPIDRVETLLSEAFHKASEFGRNVELEPECFSLDGTTSPLSRRHGFIGMCIELADRKTGTENVAGPLF
jgi:hypothetical protein